jgi:MFS family permease
MRQFDLHSDLRANDYRIQHSSPLAMAGLSSFVSGIGLGPLLTGPLGEHYGRRPIYLGTWAMFII